MSKELKIGLIGLNYASTNFGCAALSYSFLSILNNVLVSNGCTAEVTFFFSKNARVGLNDYPKVKYSALNYRVSLFDKANIRKLLCDLSGNELFFDFTSGDSFSDIYGFDRYKKTTFMKSAVELLGKTLILGPQTYGPYYSKAAQLWTKHVFYKAHSIFARDTLSLKRAKELTKKEVHLVTDVAFALEYDVSKYKHLTDSDRIKIGINMSGLLYSGGYTKNNQFGLNVDYRVYLDKLLEYLHKSDKYEIHIIPHAIAEDMTFPDNDLIPAQYYKEKYPDIIIAPVFQDPMDAKSYICHMDIFTGARMHATIAAFSSGVCCIPFSYSPKFEGLYGDLNYKRCINGKELTTDEAVETTIKYIESFSELKEEQIESVKEANIRLETFKKAMELCIKNM